MPNTFSLGPLDPVRLTEVAPRFFFALSLGGLGIQFLPAKYAVKLGIDALQTKPYNSWISLISIIFLLFSVAGTLPTIKDFLVKLFTIDEERKLLKNIRRKFADYCNHLTFEEWLIILKCLSSGDKNIMISNNNTKQYRTADLLEKKGIITEVFPDMNADFSAYILQDFVWDFICSKSFGESELFQKLKEAVESRSGDVHWFFDVNGRPHW
jgi:hypothetical protein